MAQGNHGNGDARRLDLIALGRAGVDLYGEQIGGRLEDMGSFAKYIGGSPTNTVIGLSRLGLNSGLVTRVGGDHMGRFIREELQREGVETTGVIDDPDRLTALVILGIRDPDTFPLIFYRENCADMALVADDIDPAFIARGDALLINGTHLSQPGVYAASLKAAEQMKAQGGRVVFDIDYRPVLWGLAQKANGEDRFVASADVTRELQKILPLCDLIVGTEEEVHILGGTTDTVAALRAIRAGSDALLVCKRGAAGCVALPGAVPDDLDDGIVGRGFPIEVFNVLGAGDAFMAGFLRGWLKGLPIERCCDFGNACGAIVVSRHGCAPAMASWEELQAFLARNDWPFRLRDSDALEQLHWSTNRHAVHEELTVLAIDHRSQFDDLIADLGTGDAEQVAHFKGLALAAVDRLAKRDPRYGMLLDGRFGARALEKAAELPYWIGRPIEFPGSRPIRFEGSPDVGMTLRDWPLDHVVKCLVFYHPDDSAEMKAEQDTQIRRLFDACRATRHEFLLEIIASKHGPVTSDTVSRVIDHIYDLGVYPDWWKLEPSEDGAAWTAIEASIRARDPHCRGIVLLGLSAPRDELLAGIAAAAPFPLVKGFAVGRTIFHDVAARWLSGAIDDEGAVDALSENLRVLADAWRAARRSRQAA
ncbi:5-dehydro-2-deoxygluconokinase [Sphingomonas sp. G-3-2-10]|uniref:bifunctional 5-dehydro-2-deoxygluconokinase/5-dehydro-2- deoxyphosphogluconate aldolase n=1 Tax=Sphingomonas sp. G-3-2-10 TaxID=2728838 RepID=UPI00146D1E7C|nr:5-dehydro-2-deoxygluconokinase [Sphingomonas sp. G-3-2-10]NML07450.1 5-dehydro-2-deoxygluconokinase [Sphingomonas sp. G-3-2-10]